MDSNETRSLARIVLVDYFSYPLPFHVARYGEWWFQRPPQWPSIVTRCVVVWETLSRAMKPKREVLRVVSEQSGTVCHIDIGKARVRSQWRVRGRKENSRAWKWSYGSYGLEMTIIDATCAPWSFDFIFTSSMRLFEVNGGSPPS